MKKTVSEVKFTQTGEWKALRAAEKYANQNGYDFGSMDAPNPIALVKGNYYEHELNLPHKWHNMTPAQRNNIDGIITGNFRNGPVWVTLYN